MGRSNLTRLSAVACCACVWLVPSMAWGQATGAIAGLVTDASGSILPGVTVEATNQATAQARTAVTASDGFYTIPLLSPGTYQVKASLSGFRTTIRADIVVTVNGTSRADVQLQVGQIAESVTVVGQAPLVETSNSTLGVVIDRKKVVDLPLNGRNFTQLGTLISRTNRFDPLGGSNFSPAGDTSKATLTEVNLPLTATSPSIADPLRGITGTPGFPPGLIFIGWGPDFHTPVVQHYNLTVQRQIGDLIGVEVGYVGSRGKDLPIFMEVNPTIPILSPPPRRGPRVFPAFSLVRPTFSVAKSWYQGAGEAQCPVRAPDSSQ